MAPFCPQCGEEPLRRHDLTLRDLAARAFENVTSADRRLLRSLIMILTKPGRLTAYHVSGRRRAFLGPLELFLIANALFFAVQSFTQTNIFSSPLDSHLHHQDWSGFARQIVGERLRAGHVTLEDYAPKFDGAAVLNAKALIILMVLAFAPLPAILFFRRHRPIGVHIVFALHFYAFVLLLFCTSLGIAEIDILTGGAGLLSRRLDLILSVANLLACTAYLHFACGAAYGVAGWPRFVAALLLAIHVALIVQAYRFAIFLITLYAG